MLTDQGLYFIENFVLGPATSFWFISLQSAHTALSAFFLAGDRHISAGISLSFACICLRLCLQEDSFFLCFFF